MPEGPELHLASLFVNRMCEGVVFTGDVEKSEVNKNPEVPFCCKAYRIQAQSRGKEVKLTLSPIKNDEDLKSKQQPMEVVFRFGMSGFFRFTTEEDLPKHAHLRFYTNENPRRVLSFEDTRRFGSWQPNGNWQKNRGPCVMFEYESFRENVLSNLSDKAFDKPICEALLNQKYFNGIGNYLRAEILYRLQIPPFEKARTVLEGLELTARDEKGVAETADSAVKKELKAETADLLFLCSTVPKEVLTLGEKGYAPADGKYYVLQSWMRCYSVDGMSSLTDHNGRTVWFKGNPGPMVPKGAKSRKVVWKTQKDDHDYVESKKVKNAHKDGTAKEKSGKKKISEKLQKSETQRTSKRLEKSAAIKQEPGYKNKPNSRGKRRLTAPSSAGTNQTKRQRAKEVIQEDSVSSRKRAATAKPRKKRGGRR